MPNKASPSPAFLPGATTHWTCGGRVIKVGEPERDCPIVEGDCRLPVGTVVETSNSKVDERVPRSFGHQTHEFRKFRVSVGIDHALLSFCQGAKLANVKRRKRGQILYKSLLRVELGITAGGGGSRLVS